MKCKSIVFNFRKALDLDAISKKVGKLKFVEGVNALEGRVEELRIFVLPNGVVRVYCDDGIEALLVSIKRHGAAVNEIIKHIAAISDAPILHPENIRMDQEYVDGDSILAYPFADLRPKLGETVDVRIADALIVAVFEVVGDFAAKRAQAQAGEALGRAVMKKGNPRSKKEFYKLLADKMSDLGLGKLSFSKGFDTADETGAEMFVAASKSREFRSLGTVAVAEGYLSGLILNGQPLCDLTRGFLRGAFCEFEKAEDIRVEETKCWGKGDARCEFDIC